MSDDFEMRELCPDGGCIGVIGPDGTCKECGKPSPTETQNPRYRGMVTTDGDDDDDDDESFDDERHLCPDDTCVGVLDDDGVCPECGAVVEREDEDDDEDEDDEDDDDWDDDDDGDREGGFDDRQLCPDGGCIGLIGPDGRCKECGATAK